MQLQPIVLPDDPAQGQLAGTRTVERCSLVEAVTRGSRRWIADADIADAHAFTPALFAAAAARRNVRQEAAIRSAAFSAIMMVAALVFDDTMRGITELSQTRKPSMPRSLSEGSTTASASPPMRQVPTG